MRFCSQNQWKSIKICPEIMKNHEKYGIFRNYINFEVPYLRAPEELDKKKPRFWTFQAEIFPTLYRLFESRKSRRSYSCLKMIANSKNQDQIWFRDQIALVCLFSNACGAPMHSSKWEWCRGFANLWADRQKVAPIGINWHQPQMWYRCVVWIDEIRNSMCTCHITFGSNQ